VFKETSAEELTEANGHAIFCCSTQLLNGVNFICFTLATSNDLQNDWLYASAATKNKDVGAKRLYTTMFGQLLMVTDDMSKLGYTGLISVNLGLKVYYLDLLLSQRLLPAIPQISGKFIFQQNKAPAYRAC